MITQRAANAERWHGMDNTRNTEVITDWLTLIRAEYLEVPGRRLSLGTAQRLWGLETQICEALVEGLVATSFLKRTTRNEYIRAGP